MGEYGWMGNDPSSSIVPADHNDSFPLVVRVPMSPAPGRHHKAATGSHGRMIGSSLADRDNAHSAHHPPHYELSDGAALQFVADSYRRAQELPSRAHDGNSSSSCVYCTQAFNIVSSQSAGASGG